MANEGFSEEEMVDAINEVLRIGNYEPYEETIQGKLFQIAARIQCSLTRAQNDLAEANRKLAEREGK